MELETIDVFVGDFKRNPLYTSVYSKIIQVIKEAGWECQFKGVPALFYTTVRDEQIAGMLFYNISERNDIFTRIEIKVCAPPKYARQLADELSSGLEQVASAYDIKVLTPVAVQQ